MNSGLLSNPYAGQNFFGFFARFFERTGEVLKGKLAYQDLATDEIQMLVLASVALSSALIGTFLILRKMTMLANALSHTILIGIALAYFLVGSTSSFLIEALLLGSLIMGFLTSFLTQFLTHTTALQEDASIGLVFTSLFAIGVILATVLTRDAHIGIEAVMGNADALHPDDLFWVAIVTLGNMCCFFLFFKEFTLTSFDPLLARCLGFSTLFFNYLLMFQVSLTTMTAFRAVGVILVLAFMTGPPLIARLFTHRLSTLLFSASGIGLAAALLGVALTRHLLTVHGMALSTGGVVVSLLFFTYLFLLLINLIYKSIALKKR